MNFQQYEALLKTIELGSFTKAAAELGYTQSGISHMLAALERECGCTLLYRDRSGVRLSSDGEVLLPLFRTVENAQKELLGKLSELQGLEAGLISIGTVTSVSVHWLPSIIQEFHAAHPQIQFRLRYGQDYVEIEKWISEGLVDCGFIGLPATYPNLNLRTLRRDAFVAVLPREHPLAARSSISLHELADQPFIRLEEGNDNEIAALFSESGIQPKVCFTAWDNQTILAMVSKGLGVSVLTELMFGEDPYDVVAVPLEPAAYRDLALATRREGELTAAVQTFINTTVDWIGRRYGKAE
ncbi:MAG: LysR family transcriptional regulator [Firmicutes bacterium]|nr:LysR family transcriptional regulator [Bacillota bacterium]MBQ6606454.1 LysR family transcriptional regulator [Bacillota bacterium]MBR0179204.1 LysR family transcriptional regulator [Bacillota bacterium]